MTHRPSERLASGIDRLLAVRLTAKLLTANCFLVLLWAAATWLAVHLPDDLGGPFLGLMVAIGTTVSVAVNALVLQSALRPLRELARVARAVEDGDRAARARPGRVRDPETDRVMALTNRMLDALETQRSEIARSAEELAGLSKREIAAREEERGSLARELLDDVGQSCAAVSLGLGALARAGADESLDHAAVRRRALALQALVRGVADVVSRRAHGLRPSALDELGLVAALRSAAVRWREELGVEVTVVAEDVPRLTATVGITLYRVAEEAVINAGGHAGAAHVALFVRGRAGAVELRVLDSSRESRPAEGAGDGLGLVSMRERLSLIGGKLTVTCDPGEGSDLWVVIPVGIERDRATAEP